mgnify:CR=1 FL=1
MTFAFTARHRHIWFISWMCEVLGVSRSGFHACLRRPFSTRAAHDAKLVQAIERNFKASDRTYGARQVWHDGLEEALVCGLHRIERLMRQNAMRTRPRRRDKADELLYHSDHGSRYTSEQYQACCSITGSPAHLSGHCFAMPFWAVNAQSRKPPGQFGHGELLLFPQDRKNRAQGRPHP